MGLLHLNGSLELLGAFLPALPGPPISWAGISLALFFALRNETNYWLLASPYRIAVVIGILDYVIPAKGTKYFGGRELRDLGYKYRFRCWNFCSIPFGFLIGLFVGALVGELIYNSHEGKGEH